MLTNRPFDRDTMTNIGSNREPKKSGIMSSLASAIERGKQTRLRNEARRFGKAGKPKPPKRVSEPIVSELQKQSYPIFTSDCSLAGNHISNLSDSKVDATHPITLIKNAYGIKNSEYK